MRDLQTSADWLSSHSGLILGGRRSGAHGCLLNRERLRFLCAGPQTGRAEFLLPHVAACRPKGLRPPPTDPTLGRPAAAQKPRTRPIETLTSVSTAEA